jgi:hypothetical protein
VVAIAEAVIAAHDADMGVYWPSSGPYMYATYPADPQPTTAVLVRNPSWIAPQTLVARRRRSHRDL